MATALNSVTIATTVVTMEMLWRTRLVCTVIVVVAAIEVAGGHEDEFARKQGETGQIIINRNSPLTSVKLNSQSPQIDFI